MVLQAQEGEEVDVLLDEVGAASIVLDLTIHVLVAREHDPLRHEYLDHVEEAGVAVQVEAKCVQDQLFLGDQLVLLAVVASGGLPAQRLQVVLVQLLLSVLLLLRGLVAWKLAQELSTGGHVRVLLVVFSGDEEAAEGLQHDQGLLHVLLVFSQVRGEEPVQQQNAVVGTFLDVQSERLADLS